MDRRKTRRAIAQLAGEAVDASAFARAALGVLAGAIAFDGARVLTLDPATLIPTGVAHGWGEGAHLLQSALVAESSTWGELTLQREAEPFGPAESALVAAVSPTLADGLRRAILHAPVCVAGAGDPGIALLDGDGAVVTADPAAERRLDELGSCPVVPAVAAAAARGESARARVRTDSGVWLLVRGWRLGDRTAIVIEPAGPHDLAPLRADAYGLTERERTVTQLIAHGLATATIAGRLHLSPWTVQDHLKSIFEKVGVGSRGELVARVFFEQHGPRLEQAAQ